MPLYEYLCDSCGQRIEALQRLADPPLEVCPNCEGKLKKLLSAPAFQFKGSGWYVTDYARAGGGSGKGGEKPAKSDADAGADKGDKSEKRDKGEKSDRTEKSDKSERSESSSAPAASAAPSATKP
ncbi:MAG: FmdB family transcriptional regulator, partial [Thermoanaerobaculia bacterium]|nr:FmdB family transcriptional regulator [Thermoanaerobaculia bacterium]